MAAVIGIDLGTTNTVVAVVRDGQATAIADETGQTLIPSVVSFHPNGTVLVGEAAKARKLVDPENTIYSVKRLIGRSFHSEEVQRARTRFPFEMREGPGQAALIGARGESYTLPEISAFVLRKARSLAEAYLEAPVERAVITVPANFNDLQRAATKVAGRVAGLEVLRILNEPTAAALAYGFGKASSERLAVYDFGGGTFDITLLDLSDNVFEVLATAGNTFLGGDDLDLAIADRMASEFLARHRYDLRENPLALERLRSAAELLKQKLSFDTNAEVALEELATAAGGRALGHTFRMTRAELDRLAAPIIDRTFEVCREALSVARASAQDFDEVLLVGGSTRVPQVRKRVEEFFQKPVKSHLSPDEVVAIGAAIQANALAGTERRRAGTLPLPPAAARRVPTIAGPGPFVKPPGAARTQTIPGVAMPGAQPPAIAPPGRVPTGIGLGPSRPMPPPRREARAAEPAPPPKTTEKSVTYTLSDDEIEELAAPIAPVTYPHEETTKRGVSAFPPADDEPTQAGRAGAATQALARGGPPSAPPQSIPSLAPATVPWELPQPSVPPPPELSLPPPLLVDVTPLTLSVETVSGFCDSVIARNTQVPCEQTREFVTAADGQTVVRVRVAQGESRVFAENTLLGEVELSELPSLPRGNVQIAVTFGLDKSGMLHVSARETRTGKATAVALRLVGLPEASEIATMTDRHLARPAG